MQDIQEQREHQRLQTRIGVEIRLHSENPGQDHSYVEAVTRDISAGGVFIELAELQLSTDGDNPGENCLMIKSLLDMLISLPVVDEKIKATGKVVWIERKKPGKTFVHGVAISFTQIPAENRRIIDQFVLNNV